MSKPNEPEIKIVRIKDIALRYGCTERTVFTYQADGVIPKPRKLPGKRWPFWYEHELLANENRSTRLKARKSSATLPKTTQPTLNF